MKKKIAKLLGKRANHRHPSHQRISSSQKTFIDLFAGCGGLSLGLLTSGWKGLLAIEENPDAFKTLRYNLVDKGNHNKRKPSIDWPSWLAKEPYEINDFVNRYGNQLQELQGLVKLVAGGPPCQGFSFVGKRNGNDPRNELFKHHLEVVRIIQPEIVLLENVRGIKIAFTSEKTLKKKNRGKLNKSHAAQIKEMLENCGNRKDHGYHVQQNLVTAADFGVPQLRPRHFTIGIRKDLFTKKKIPDFFEILNGKKDDFLKEKRLPIDRHISVAEAISDLTTYGKDLVDCQDPESPSGFKEISYDKPVSRYQKLMHRGLNGNLINSLRLVNHKPETIQRFKQILGTCRKGRQPSNEDRTRIGIRTRIVPLAPDKPSHTLTTLPDDLLHYSEPRVHTVREHARFQSFPDWFEFKGKYTTGGNRRTLECPRYTQVGNAIPPLLAEILGKSLANLLDKSDGP